MINQHFLELCKQLYQLITSFYTAEKYKLQSANYSNIDAIAIIIQIRRHNANCNIAG